MQSDQFTIKIMCKYIIILLLAFSGSAYAESRLYILDSGRRKVQPEIPRTLRLVRRLPSEPRAILPVHCYVGWHLTTLNDSSR